MENHKHDVKHLETKIKELSRSMESLGDIKDFEELIIIIHKPGWTTPAEFLLVTGIVEAMTEKAKALAGLKRVLMDGSRAVKAK